MSNSFFVHAKTLSIVDQFISQARKRHIASKNANNKHLDKKDDITPDFPSESVFELMKKGGVALELLNKIFEAFIKFDFENTSSVGGKIKWFSGTKKEDAYEMLEKINLYDHSTRVATNGLLDKSIDLSERPLVALFGLMHDMGKSEKLCEFYGVAKAPHEIRSAELIEIFLMDTPYRKLGELFCKDLRVIVSSKKNKNDFELLGLYGKALHKADTKAREQEIKSIEEGER